MEVASALTLQGNEILHSDVTILEGHTSEVWLCHVSLLFL
jgi:hypothetical protein